MFTSLFRLFFDFHWRIRMIRFNQFYCIPKKVYFGTFLEVAVKAQHLFGTRRSNDSDQILHGSTCFEDIFQTNCSIFVVACWTTTWNTAMRLDFLELYYKFCQPRFLVICQITQVKYGYKIYAPWFRT